MKKYKLMCSECGDKHYLLRRSMKGITISVGTCPVCKKEKVGIIPASDWAYGAGEAIMWD